MPKVQFFIISILALFIPIISLYTPLAMASVFVIAALYPTVIFIKKGGFKACLKDSWVNKILVITLAYALISSFWAIVPMETLYLWVRVALIFIGYMALFAYAGEMIFKEKILKYLLCGIIFGLLVANIEMFTAGAISTYFGFIDKGTHKFEVFLFNRGASLLSIMSWAIICYLFAKKKYKMAIGFALIVFLTIVRMDSLSAVMGFSIGSIVFSLVYFKVPKVLKTLAVFSIFAVFIVAFAAMKLDAHKLVGNVAQKPGAASDIRLYIYDYSAKQAYKKPFFGWGFNASRNYPVDKSDYVEKDIVEGGRSPLPLHPHNNVLQVWLELGGVGMVLFAAFLFSSLWQISGMKVPPYVMAAYAALFSDYFIIGETGFGMWQNWLVCSGILAAFFLQIARRIQPQ